MNLVIRGLSLNDNELSRTLVGRFDERGGSIGRSDGATLALPDPERLISRVQATVSFVDGEYWLEDVGRSRSVVHNGQPLDAGARVRLTVHDDLRIAGYRLAVEYENDDPGATILRGRTTTRPGSGSEARGLPPLAPLAPIATPGAANPFSDLLSDSGAGVNISGVPDAGGPFADLGIGVMPQLGSKDAMLVPPAGHASSHVSGQDPFADLKEPLGPPRGPSAPRNAEPSPAAPARLPDDFDPFAANESDGDRGAGGPDAPAPSGSNDPFEAIANAGSRRGNSIDEMFGLGAVAGSDPLAGFLRSNPDGEQAPVEPPAERDDTPHLRAALSLPDIIASGAPPRRPSPQPAPLGPVPARSTAAPTSRQPAADAASAHSADQVWRSFLEGAGVEIPLPGGVTPGLMRLVGAMLRESVQGLVQLIRMRAATKAELRAEHTLIQPRENNPLKFSTSVEATLTQLLQPPDPGGAFLSGPAAIHGAIDALTSHHIGTMAGMRAALAGVLARFDPTELEGRLGAGGLLETLLPVNRKARLWELYLKNYSRILTEAQEDFDELFGNAFTEEYERQERLLKQGRSNASGSGG